jgi:hypothetical protein
MKDDAPLPDDLADLLRAEREIDPPDTSAYDRVYGQLAAAIPGLITGPGTGGGGAPPDGTGSPGGGGGGSIPGAAGAGAAVGAGLKAKIAIATVAALAFAGGGAATHAWVATPPPPPAVVSTSASAPGAVPPAASVVTAETTAPSVLVVPSSRTTSSATPPRHEGASSLRDERLLIETASTALARGDAASAIGTLKKHAATYPRGDLAQEREVLWVRALRASGNDAAAQERARAFRRNYPSSLQQAAMDRAARGE